MNLLQQLYVIQDDLNSIPADSIPKHLSGYWSRAMNRLMDVIADGERRASKFSKDIRGPDARSSGS